MAERVPIHSGCELFESARWPDENLRVIPADLSLVSYGKVRAGHLLQIVLQLFGSRDLRRRGLCAEHDRTIGFAVSSKQDFTCDTGNRRSA